MILNFDSSVIFITLYLALNKLKILGGGGGGRFGLWEGYPKVPPPLQKILYETLNILFLYFCCLVLCGALPLPWFFELKGAHTPEVQTPPLTSTLNRFDAVSAYMRKMERYGLSDF